MPNNNLIPQENSKNSHRSIILSVVVVLGVFVVIIAVYFWWFSCRFIDKCEVPVDLQINGEVIKRNEIVAKLTVQVIQNHLDGLSVIGSFYAADKEVIRKIQQREWLGAINMMAGAFKEDDLKSIDRIALFDVTGTTMANLPEQSQLLGQNFSYRDWYQGVMTNFKPYVSEVYVRATNPPANVVGLAFPVKNNSDVPIAILLFTIKTDSFLKWLDELRFGESGMTFIVDKRGYIVAHPDIPPQGEIVDYSSRTDVQKVVSGQSGSEITLSLKNERILSSYEPIPGYHWGVVTKVKIDELKNYGLVKEGQISGGGGGLYGNLDKDY